MYCNANIESDFEDVINIHVIDTVVVLNFGSMYRRTGAANRLHFFILGNNRNCKNSRMPE